MPASSKEPIKSPRFSALLRTELERLGTNPRQFSAKVDYAYDYIRRVHNGVVFPGDRLLKSICEKLGWNFEEMRQLVEADRADEKGWVAPPLKDDPLLNELTTYWPLLSKKDKKEILELVKMAAGA